SERVSGVVKSIIRDIRSRGDEALLEYTNRFEQRDLASAKELIIGRDRLVKALEAVSAEQKTALEQAAERIRFYHEHQKQDSWQYTESNGTVLGQKVTPMDRVGMYVPGGKAVYPSSVLMAVIPAK